jgi:ribosomal protein L32
VTLPSTSPAPPPPVPRRRNGPPRTTQRLSEADRKALLERDKQTGLTEFERRQCEHCGGVHSRACYRVKRRVERTTPDGGRVLEVEYFETWTQPNVIWPEMLGVLDEKEVDGG